MEGGTGKAICQEEIQPANGWLFHDLQETTASGIASYAHRRRGRPGSWCRRWPEVLPRWWKAHRRWTSHRRWSMRFSSSPTTNPCRKTFRSQVCSFRSRICSLSPFVFWNTYGLPVVLCRISFWITKYWVHAFCLGKERIFGDSQEIGDETASPVMFHHSRREWSAEYDENAWFASNKCKDTIPKRVRNANGVFCPWWGFFFILFYFGDNDTLLTILILVRNTSYGVMDSIVMRKWGKRKAVIADRLKAYARFISKNRNLSIVRESAKGKQKGNCLWTVRHGNTAMRPSRSNSDVF